LRCDEIKAWSTPQVEWEQNAIVKKSIYFLFCFNFFILECTFEKKKPFIGIQGSKYDGKALKKAFENIT